MGEPCPPLPSAPQSARWAGNGFTREPGLWCKTISHWQCLECNALGQAAVGENASDRELAEEHATKQRHAVQQIYTVTFIPGERR